MATVIPPPFLLIANVGAIILPVLPFFDVVFHLQQPILHLTILKSLFCQHLFLQNATEQIIKNVLKIVNVSTLTVRGIRMKLTHFLQQNLSWTLNKNKFGSLCCTSTCEKQLVDQLYRLSDRYFPQRKKIETEYTEFCLNEIALCSPHNAAQKCVLQQFEGYWQSFLRLKNIFSKDFMTLPADGNVTRLELVAQLVARCTQFSVDSTTLSKICLQICEIFDFEEREARNLNNVLELYKINFYCAVAKGVMKNNNYAKIRLAKMLSPQLNVEYVFNSNLRQCGYATEKIAANVDCLGKSATKFHQPTHMEMKPYFYANGKNVFDTFCFSKFGENTAEFKSESCCLRVEMQYFLQDCCEVRKYTLTNLGKGSKSIVADFWFRHVNASNKTTYFSADGALCIAVEGDDEFYSALALVCNNSIVHCPFEEGRLSTRFVLPSEKVLQFDLVTVYAENMPTLANELSYLNNFGATRCPYLEDLPSQNVINLSHPIHPTPHGYSQRLTLQKQANTLNFSYQLGNDIATFLDNSGHCATLLRGFAFGVCGEKVYSVKNGKISQLNCDKFLLEKDNIVYKKNSGETCTISHGQCKTFTISYGVLQKTLFYFPFEEQSTVTFSNNVFTVENSLRKFTVECVGKVESYTTNALDCNTERLRYKFCNDVQCGNCLAICFASCLFLQLKISAAQHIATPNPLVRESLVSTYLNYVNNKNTFCLSNFLKRADSLTLAAITFTNPQFVKQYILQNLGKETFYYDVAGRKKPFYDKLAVPLAAVYYANLATDSDFPSAELKKFVSSVIFKETYSGFDLCIKALILKKATHIDGFDKVKCIIEYNNVKKIILADSKLYGFAQAIGAVNMCNPSKERLKDLCNKYDIPKSWYYVSQLENLYGMSLVAGALHFAPKVTQENVLEQLALCVCGKRIDTTFSKSTVQSMTLNGTQYFVPFKTQSLKNPNNTLVVRY